MSSRRKTEERSASGWPQLWAGALVPPLLLGLAVLGWWLPCRPASSQAAREPASAEAMAAAMDEARPGDTLYRRRCARCHADDGTGAAARTPNFSSHRWQAAHGDATLRASILEGKGTQMPAFSGKITEPEARDLVARIRTFDPTPVVKPTAGTSTGMTTGPPDDFEERFRRLEEELQELKKKFHELSTPPKKP